MNNLIKIGNQSISQKEINGMRVVTLSDIDNVHERPAGTARRNFNANKNHLIEGEDYCVRNSYEAKEQFGIKAPSGLYLITESGYLMLVKSFTDDLAWTVQRQLVSKYFNKDKPLSAMGMIRLQNEALIELDTKIDVVNEDLQEFKRDMPLLAVECQKIISAKNRKVVPLLGGKNASAYKNASIRNRVYRDLETQIRREFGVDTYKAIKRRQCGLAIKIIEEYELPMALEEEIRSVNSQFELDLGGRH